MSSEAALLEEISRLSGAIDRKKTTSEKPQHKPHQRPPPHHSGPSFHKPPYRSRQPYTTEYVPNKRPSASQASTPLKDVVIDGVTFESNGKKLIRKDAPHAVPAASGSSSGLSTGSTQPLGVAASDPGIAPSKPIPQPTSAPQPQAAKTLVRTRNGLIAADRYKPVTQKAASRAQLLARPTRPRYPPVVTGYPKRAIPGRNLTLNKKRDSAKLKKYQKQCKHFTRTGASTQVMESTAKPQSYQTCFWGSCLAWPDPHLQEFATVASPAHTNTTPRKLRFVLSSSQRSVPSRTSLKNAPFLTTRLQTVPLSARDLVLQANATKAPPVFTRMSERGPKSAFAVILPFLDIATGVCKRMGLKGAAGCKLPHVIRANQKRIGIAKVPKNADASATPLPNTTASTSQVPPTPTNVSTSPRQSKGIALLGSRPTDVDTFTGKKRASPEREGVSSTTGISVGFDDGDEFISLTFLESDDEEEDEDEDEDEDDAEEGEEGDEADDSVQDDEMADALHPTDSP
ncbi:hypothetical protein FRB99_000778 [Tulasnella sp. 403]|nr:hypothetical protein FRB99_000778 [Tulasnella sp. 403]